MRVQLALAPWGFHVPTKNVVVWRVGFGHPNKMPVYPIGVSDNTIGFEPIEKGSIPLWGVAPLVHRITPDHAKVVRQVRLLYGACGCGVMVTQHAVNVSTRVRIPASACAPVV